jgi:hypothetical protein
MRFQVGEKFCLQSLEILSARRAGFVIRVRGSCSKNEHDGLGDLLNAARMNTIRTDQCAFHPAVEVGLDPL